VVAARDKKLDPENNFVAIKKIEKAFEHKIFTKRTLRELRLLRLLKHENVREHWGFDISISRLSESTKSCFQNAEKSSRTCIYIFKK
jgi:serine/threonine protein kinase